MSCRLVLQAPIGRGSGDGSAQNIRTIWALFLTRAAPGTKATLSALQIVCGRWENPSTYYKKQSVGDPDASR